MAWGEFWSNLCTRLADLLRPAEPPSALALETPRLRLREFEERDLADMHAYRSDPEVLRFLSRARPFSRWEVSQFLALVLGQKWHPRRERYQLGVYLAEERRLIGECSLDLLYPEGQTEAPDVALIGFMLHRDYWGRGYATETARALVRFGLEELRLDAVHAGCLPENEASRRVLEKVGLVCQGLQADFPGSPVGREALTFRIDRAAWLAREPDANKDSLRRHAHAGSNEFNENADPQR